MSVSGNFSERDQSFIHPANRGETARRPIIEWNGTGADRIFLHHIG